MNDVQIPYKPNKIIFILAIMFFGACSAFMRNIAATNNKGLILIGIVEFSTQGATVFYWIITGLSAAFVLVGVFALIKSAFSKREIIISYDSIKSPKNGFSKIDVIVKFSEITNITIQMVQKTKILNIDHLNGRLSIPNSMLPNKEAFEDLVSQLKIRVNV